MGKLKHHPSSFFTPDLMLRQLLEHSDEMRAVYVIVEWSDESMDFHQSQARTSKICMAATVMQEVAQRSLHEPSNCTPESGRKGA
jgi:hypothetical protein